MSLYSSSSLELSSSTALPEDKAPSMGLGRPSSGTEPEAGNTDRGDVGEKTSCGYPKS